MVDKVATEMLRKEAEDKVQPIYKVDLTVQIELEKTIDSFFLQLEELIESEEYEFEQKLEILENNAVVPLDKDSYRLLLSSSQSDLKQAKDNIRYLINQILNERLTKSSLKAKKKI